jgi:hypothetical protein
MVWEKTSVPAVLVDPGRKMVDVVGEASFQGSLEGIAGGRTIDGARNRDHTALLIPEPTNPYDPNAVRVVVVTGAGFAGAIGYLSRDDAVAYRPAIDRLAAEGQVLACRASLSGGWDRGSGDRGSFGVRLAMGTPDEVAKELDSR